MRAIAISEERTVTSPQDPYDRASQPPYGYERAPGSYQPAPPPAARQAAPARPAPAPRKAAKRKKKGSPLVGCLAVVALIGVIIWAVVSLTSHSGPSAAWKANVQDFNVLSPADLAVTVRVTNTGQEAGTPTCTVQASDPTNTYIGTDVGTLSKPMAAGSYSVYVDNVTITKQGAQYVTNVTVSCS
jgi:hypothetical protein